MRFQRLQLWRKQQTGLVRPQDVVEIGETVEDGWSIVDCEKVTRLEDYENLGIIGTGATATVFAARHTLSGEVVALKVMPKAVLLKKIKEGQLLREREIMTHIDGPHVAQFHEAFQTPANAVYVLELLPGGDLHSYVESHPAKRLSEECAKYYAAQIFVALEDLHRQGVAYRDLKPENVLLDSEGNAKLADFGLSRLMKDGDLAGSFVGTAAFLAPEIVKGKQYTNIVDWWSFGVLVHGLLTGRSAFPGASFEAIFKSIAHEPVRFPARHTLSPEAVSFVSDLLHRRVSHRLTGSAIAEHPWFQSVPWEAIRNRETLPPKWHPVQRKSYEKMSGQPLRDPTSAPITEAQQELFNDFNFRNNSLGNSSRCTRSSS
eukprot:gene18451-28476_t